jgi:hypothetical protein
MDGCQQRALDYKPTLVAVRNLRPAARFTVFPRANFGHLAPPIEFSIESIDAENWNDHAHEKEEYGQG